MPLPFRFTLPVLMSLVLTSLPALGSENAPRVLASIKPVHSLVAAVMEGVGEPELIVEGAGSPHGYALKPSQAEAMAEADLIFWVGPQLETFLEKPVETIASGARLIELMEADGVTTLAFREGGAFEAHEEETGADGHGHNDGHDHGDGNDHDDGHGHAEEGADPHVWLDPENAKAFVAAISEALSATDPANAALYAANAARESEKLDALVAEINTALAPVRGKPFIVFHDAYHYFENRFDIEAAGSLTVNPEIRPGAERMTEIRNKVKTLNAACAFAEPQFDNRLVAVAIEGSNARSAVLDPLGAELEDGPELYFTLIRGLANAMAECLSR